MTEMKPPQAMSLFDLIGRSWELQEPLQQVLFNAKDTSVLVRHADGRLSFLPVADSEDPESRLRMELETGRMTIRPREKPLPIPMGEADALAAVEHAVCRNGTEGFAFIHRSKTEVWRATARGQALRCIKSERSEFTALAEYAPEHALVTASHQDVSLWSGETGAMLRNTQVAHPVDRLSASPNGDLIACWGADQITLLAARDFAIETVISCDGDVSSFAWSPDHRWLVAGCRDKSVLLCDLKAAKSDRIVDFPSSVDAVDFNEVSGAFVASGAFRVVGWLLPELPFGDHEGQAIETGKPGLTIVETVSTHPKLDLCAVGYANGLVTLCKVGHKDEMLVREGGSQAVQSLAWSSDGAHLALATADGLAAIVTFPKSMFK